MAGRYRSSQAVLPTLLKLMAPITKPLSSPPSFFPTVIVGGLAIGILDGLDAIVFYGLIRGAAPEKISQAIASGVLGRSSFQAGWLSVLLGIVLHFLISFGAATVFYAGCRASPALLRQPFLAGPAFGLVVYAVMYGLVLPLSAFPLKPSGTSGPGLVNELLAHVLFVGLPVALLASRSARLRPTPGAEEISLDAGSPSASRVHS